MFASSGSMDHPAVHLVDENARCSSNRVVLLIDDNDDHAELVRRALRRSGRPHLLVHFEDGERALSFLEDADGDASAGATCALILLDLRLPRVDGLEVLRRLHAKERVVHVPVVVLTTSETATDIAAAYEHGAHAYLVKPGDFGSFGELVQDLVDFWLGWNKTPSFG